MSEDKLVRFEDGKLKVKFSKSLDPNKDGEPLGAINLELEVDLAEIPDEAVDAWKKLKDKK